MARNDWRIQTRATIDDVEQWHEEIAGRLADLRRVFPAGRPRFALAAQVAQLLTLFETHAAAEERMINLLRGDGGHAERHRLLHRLYREALERMLLALQLDELEGLGGVADYVLAPASLTRLLDCDRELFLLLERDGLLDGLSPRRTTPLPAA